MDFFFATDYYAMIFNEMVKFYQGFLSGGVSSAILILAVGAVLSVEISRAARELVKKMGADKALEAMGAKSFFKKGGIKFSVADFTGWLVKWFIILFALLAAVDYLKLQQVSAFLQKILDYIPNLVGALAVLTVGLIFAQLISEAIDGAAKATGIRAYALAAIVAKWILIIITMLVVVEQTGIGSNTIQIFAGGLSIMIAIAGGLAFGLGGQYHAKELLDEIKNKVSRK
jgi:hypothetical protein